MKKKIVYRFFIFVLFFIVSASGMGIYAHMVAKQLPGEIYLQNNRITTLQLGLPVTAENDTQKVNLSRPVAFAAEQTGSYPMQIKLFGVFDIRTVDVNVVEPDYVYPCGFQIGLYLKTDGVLAVNTQSITDIYGNEVNPCENIIRQGDYILAVNAEKVSSKGTLAEAVKKCSGTEVVFTILRNGQQFDVSVTPVMDEGGNYKIGLWVKDDAQGIGTMTYIDSSGGFGALGHGISDETTAGLLTIHDGRLYKTKIVSIIKGTEGTPGEFIGTIDYQEKNFLGSIRKNTVSGIFGTLDKNLAEEYELEYMQVGYSHEVEKGKAYIRMYTDNSYQDYQIEIDHISYGGQKNLTFTVKSPELLAMTNGIVQGMSGSPILQNGKFVGAVTHVFIDNPTKGYGIFAETMLKEGK